MKNYDIAKAREIIELFKSQINEASLGMREDYFWTATEMYPVDGYERDGDCAGIMGSAWATPILLLEMKDGTSRLYECHDGGESDTSGPNHDIWGELSGPSRDHFMEMELLPDPRV